MLISVSLCRGTPIRLDSALCNEGLGIRGCDRGVSSPAAAPPLIQAKFFEFSGDAPLLAPALIFFPLTLCISFGRRNMPVGIYLTSVLLRPERFFLPGLQMKPGKLTGVTCVYAAFGEDGLS